jgi:hypothetical protein
MAMMLIPQSGMSAIGKPGASVSVTPACCSSSARNAQRLRAGSSEPVESVDEFGHGRVTVPEMVDQGAK